MKNNSRLVIIVNENYFYGFDLKTEDTLVCQKIELSKYIDFFLPLIGIEKINLDKEKSANEKAAEKFATLYNELYMLARHQPKKLKANTTVQTLFCFILMETFKNGLCIICLIITLIGQEMI